MIAHDTSRHAPDFQDRPRRRAQDLECQALDDEIMVIDAATDQVHFLNSGMAAVWTLCDGSRSAEQIADDLAERYDCDDLPDLHRAVDDALQNLSKLGLLTDRV